MLSYTKMKEMLMKQEEVKECVRRVYEASYGRLSSSSSFLACIYGCLYKPNDTCLGGKQIQSSL